MKDKILDEYVKLYALKILKNGVEKIDQDKVLEPYYDMKYVKELKKELKK